MRRHFFDMVADHPIPAAYRDEAAMLAFFRALAREDSKDIGFASEVLLIYAKQKKIPEPPVDLEDASRNALLLILLTPPKQRRDFRRHLRILCRFVETGSLRSAGRGEHKGPTRDLRDLQKRLGCCPLMESYADERGMTRVRPSATARIISDWLTKHPEIIP